VDLAADRKGEREQSWEGYNRAAAQGKTVKEYKLNTWNVEMRSRVQIFDGDLACLPRAHVTASSLFMPSLAHSPQLPTLSNPPNDTKLCVLHARFLVSSERYAMRLIASILTWAQTSRGCIATSCLLL
jgi:hypothetical protein